MNLDVRRQARWRWAQFVLTCVFGCAAFGALLPETIHNPKVPLVGGLIAGFGGNWLVMFCVSWWRFGWHAARSMRMG